MALTLSKVFDTSVGFWVNTNNKYELYKVLLNEEKTKKINELKPLVIA